MVRGIAHRVKQYVEVIARHDAAGEVWPLAIIWCDGRRFAIDEVLDRRQAASLKVGGTGLRFLVRIQNTTTFLYLENPRWFVEAIIPDDSGSGGAGSGSPTASETRAKGGEGPAPDGFAGGADAAGARWGGADAAGACWGGADAAGARWGGAD